MALLLTAVMAATTSLSAAPALDQIEFFEKRIRPLLAERCYECHGEQKQKGGLRIDSRDGWVKGGESGTAVRPGKPDESLLIRAVRYTDKELQMPPKNQRLAPQQIADLETWIRTGAIDPRTNAPSATISPSAVTLPFDLATERKKWAFAKPTNPPTPSVKDTSWPKSPIDRFILAKLEANRLRPAPTADKRTLLRRVTVDLTGLPPTPAETASFLADSSPTAFAKVVDRLLASPRYGERWARHWLDVVRYADSLDARSLGKDGDILDAWRYRDWVVDALNRDLPYDEFIRQQIAGDILAAQTNAPFDAGKIIATSLYAIGSWGNGDSDKKKVYTDIVDDQIDVTGRAFLGLTVACARCHDHKFDPITQRDYYGLAGFFFSSRILAKFNAPTAGENIMRIPIAPPTEQATRDALQQRIAAIDAKIAGGLVPFTVVQRDVQNKPGLHSWSPKDAPNPSLVINTTTNAVAFITIKLPARAIALHPGPKTPVTAAWRSPLAGRVRVSAKLIDVDPTCGNGVTWSVRHAGKTLSEGAMDNGKNVEFTEQEVTVAEGDLLQLIIGPRNDYSCDSTQVEFRIKAADGRAWSLHEALINGAKQGQDNLWWICAGEGAQLANDKPDLAALQAERKRLTAELKPPAMTHGFQEGGIPKTEYEGFNDVRLHGRGRYDRLGDVVPRAFPVVLATTQPRIASGSGRLDLARWISSAENPLTARVMMNRLWQHHFGEGLVRTANNFGKLGETPTHPELLDWLASRFTESGWSLKAMHRLMVNSAAYQQSSGSSLTARSDPDNRLFGRQNRQRLDAEALRDSLVAAAGALDFTLGGPSFRELETPRRTLYLMTARSDRSNYRTLFDAADPDSIVEKRTESTVAPQALFLLNHPFAQAQAKALARRAAKEAPAETTAQIGWLYQTLYGRPPLGKETALGIASLAPETGGTVEDRLDRYCHALLCANEFIYVD